MSHIWSSGTSRPICINVKTMAEFDGECTYTAPKKHPTSYKAVTVPKSEVCSGPPRFKVSRKSGVTMTPPAMTRYQQSVELPFDK